MLTPETAADEQGGCGDSEVAATTASSVRTGRSWWKWWWAPCSVRSRMVCCGRKQGQGMRGSEPDAGDGSKRRSDRCDHMSCRMTRRRGSQVPCTRRLPDDASFHKNPLHSKQIKVVACTDVLVDDQQSQKLAVQQIDPPSRSESSDYLGYSSGALPSARYGGCPVAGMPIPPGHRCSWCHTCAHPGPTVYLVLADGG